jgi:large subunit ribosomal protein L5
MKEKYENEVVSKLQELHGYANVHQIPTVTKVVVNMGLGEAVQNSKVIDSAVADLTLLTGQKPVIRKAKKSIANFKLREGMPIGVSVTLRGQMMWEFIDRLVTVGLPRVRDFRGISRKAFDGRGNYSLGIAEQIIFPEIDMEKTQIRGLSITVVTTANTNAEGESLLEFLGFPFKKKHQKEALGAN